MGPRLSPWGCLCHFRRGCLPCVEIAPAGLLIPTPDSRPFTSTSVVLDMTIEDLDGHLSECAPNHPLATLPFVRDSDLCIR